MSKIEKRIAIDSWTERVFSYVSEPVKSAEVWPGLLEAREVHRLIGDLTYARWLYKITGLHELQDILLQFEADQHTLMNDPGNYELVMTFRLHPDDICGPRLALDGDDTYWSQC